MQPSFTPVCDTQAMRLRFWNQESAYPLHVTLHFFGVRDAAILEPACQHFRAIARMPYYLRIAGIDILSYTSFGDRWGMDVLREHALHEIPMPERGNAWQLVLRCVEDAELDRLRNDRMQWLSYLEDNGYTRPEQRDFKPHMKIGDVQRADMQAAAQLVSQCKAVWKRAQQHDIPLIVSREAIMPIGRAVGACAFRYESDEHANARLGRWLAIWRHEFVALCD